MEPLAEELALPGVYYAPKYMSSRFSISLSFMFMRPEC